MTTLIKPKETLCVLIGTKLTYFISCFIALFFHVFLVLEPELHRYFVFIYFLTALHTSSYFMSEYNTSWLLKWWLLTHFRLPIFFFVVQ